MIKASISLQDLRRRIYLKAKADQEWRFWGLYVHVCKPETLREAYAMARRNGGAAGIDGVTFDAIEEAGLAGFLEGIRGELVSRAYRPSGNRRVEIPKDGGKVRTLGIPTIRDRVVQGALKLILEPVFEADFQEGSYGYRPKRTAHQAVHRVTTAVVQNKTMVIDVDLASYFDTVRHDILLGKVAARVEDDQVLRLLKLILKAGGKRGVPQGGVISPLLSNLYLNEVDKMLERAKEVTRQGRYHYIEYARFADDLVILIDGYRRWRWLEKAAYKRLLEELAKLEVELNRDKTRRVDLANGESFRFLGFEIRRAKTRRGKWGVRCVADNEGTHQTPAPTQGSVPTLSLATGAAGRGPDQPDPAWMGELFLRRACEQMFRSGQGLGREEDTATSDATARTSGIWLEEVE